jgi:catechol 2,3-dioxygenase-like lactoylglutathione lyase family enzyme
MPRIFETALYADDLAAATEFYQCVIGLEMILRTDLFVVFRCEESVLLIFDPAKSSEPSRRVPAHGATGAGHVAFAAEAQDIDTWRKTIIEHGVTVEADITWEGGGRSLYFRDPAGNSVEFATPNLWRHS